jgi:hypothetical protein
MLVIMNYQSWKPWENTPITEQIHSVIGTLEGDQFTGFDGFTWFVTSRCTTQLEEVIQ